MNISMQGASIYRCPPLIFEDMITHSFLNLKAQIERLVLITT